MKIQNLPKLSVKQALPPKKTEFVEQTLQRGLENWLKAEASIKKELGNLPARTQSFIKVQRSVQDLNLGAQLASQIVEGISGGIKKITQNG